MTQIQRRQASLARGRWAEDQALDFLQSEGLMLIARNVRYRCGELDLIMTDGLQVVFIEVRYWSRSDYGSAAASVDHRKRQRLVRAALPWLSLRPGPLPACRFDVVVMGPGQRLWLPGVFLAGGLL